VNDAAWWARVVQARTERDDLRPQRVWTLHRGEHAAAIDLKAVPGIGAEIVLTVDGELRKTRLFRSHEQAQLVGAIADTRRCSRRRGGRERPEHRTGAALIRWTPVRPATRAPWSYDHHDSVIRAAEREGFNRLANRGVPSRDGLSAELPHERRFAHRAGGAWKLTCRGRRSGTMSWSW
jgi:hypothetical protein